MSRTLLWIFFSFGLLAGAATLALSFYPEAEADFSRFLRVLTLIAWGISAYYFKRIRDARRLQARHVGANHWPRGLQIYCDPRLQKRLVWAVVWIVALAGAKVVLQLSGVLERLN